MTLSEAIRLGAMLKPKGTRRLYASGHTCALGAALDAAGMIDVARAYRDLQSDYTAAEARWPILRQAVPLPPLLVPEFDVSNVPDVILVRYAITMFNDRVGWTREQIADWVETVERKQCQAVEPL